MFDRFKLSMRRMRVRLAELSLPDRYYVQEKPFATYFKGDYPDFDPDVRIFNRRSDKTIRDGNRWLVIRMLMDQAASCRAGEYAELGTHQGRTARLIFKNMLSACDLYCFDTFEGFDEKDVQIESECSSFEVRPGDYGNTSEERVVRSVVGDGDRERLIIRKGYFPDTAEGLEGVKWRFVHLDCDLAAPMKAGLWFFWKNLQPGGVILMHDFFGGFREGIQTIFEEFARETGCVAVPMCDGGGSAAVTKPSK